jgi:hypothetical protein
MMRVVAGVGVGEVGVDEPSSPHATAITASRKRLARDSLDTHFLPDVTDDRRGGLVMAELLVWGPGRLRRRRLTRSCKHDAIGLRAETAGYAHG